MNQLARVSSSMLPWTLFHTLAESLSCLLTTLNEMLHASPHFPLCNVTRLWLFSKQFLWLKLRSLQLPQCCTRCLSYQSVTKRPSKKSDTFVPGECGVWLDFSDLHGKKTLLQRTEVYLCHWFWNCEYFCLLHYMLIGTCTNITLLNLVYAWDFFCVSVAQWCSIEATLPWPEGCWMPVKRCCCY